MRSGTDDGDHPASPGARPKTDDPAGVSRMEIPSERLPPGFAERVEERPDDPAPARPAATVVLMRDRKATRGAPAAGLEVLLLRRVRSSAFVPGAWVFPGGRVDSDDATGALVSRLDGVTRASAADRLGIPLDDDPPAVAYWIAALREAFEETGILIGHDASGGPAPAAGDDPSVAGLRDEILADEDAFPSVLDRMGCRMAGDDVAYVAHWITPTPEPRRYDTRFFAAAVRGEVTESISAAEMSDGVWLSPRDALARRERGELPMVFPTLRTLEDLAPFERVDDVLDAYAEAEVPTIQPTLVRTPTGVAIEVE